MESIGFSLVHEQIQQQAHPDNYAGKLIHKTYKEGQKDIHYFLGAHILNDGLSISRVYGSLPMNIPVIKISWNFNSSGRIRDLCMKVLQPYKTSFHPLIITASNKKDWILAPVMLYPLPLEINQVDYMLYRKDYEQRYLSLVSYGHKTLKELKDNAENEEIVPLRSDKFNQKPLTDILSNQSVLKVLEESQKIIPYDITMPPHFNALGEQKAEIVYLSK